MGKYSIRGRNFWLLHTPFECSWSWRSILKWKVIGNGNETFMDGTVDGYRNSVEVIFTILSYHSVWNKTARVANIILGDQWSIHDFVKGVVPHLATLVEEQQIEGMAKWVWTALVEGEYSLKSTMV